MIRRFDLKTPGREVEDGRRGCARGCRRRAAGSRGELVAAFGGRANIQSLDACITRLRVELRGSGAGQSRSPEGARRGRGREVGNGLQAIFGTRSENLKTDIEAYLRATGADLAASTAASVAAAPTPRPSSVPDADVLRAGASIADALGGARNIVSAEACALTRVRVQVRDTALVNEDALRRAGVAGVMRLDGGVLHLIVGPKADVLAMAMTTKVPGALTPG